MIMPSYQLQSERKVWSLRIIIQSVLDSNCKRLRPAAHNVVISELRREVEGDNSRFLLPTILFSNCDHGRPSSTWELSDRTNALLKTSSSWVSCCCQRKVVHVLQLPDSPSWFVICHWYIIAFENMRPSEGPGSCSQPSPDHQDWSFSTTLHPVQALIVRVCCQYLFKSPGPYSNSLMAD